MNFREVFYERYYAPSAQSPFEIIVPTNLDDIAVSNNPDMPKNDSMADLAINQILEHALPEVSLRYRRLETAIYRSRMRAEVSGGLKNRWKRHRRNWINRCRP